MAEISHESPSTPSFLFDNVNKILSTFVPARIHQRLDQSMISIGVKSHGTITFTDNKSNRAEFIRIPPNTSVVKVKELLYQQWFSERPSLVISVTGGAKDYNMKPKLLRAFRHGLLKVARTTGAWIITGGMNTGIMKLVGEIVQTNPYRSRPIRLIGIGTWGCVSGAQQLEVHGSTVHYTKPGGEVKGEAPIEPNHTHFIFVDDGSLRKYGAEITFRAHLEQVISGDFFGSQTSPSPTGRPSVIRGLSVQPEQSDPVPVVLLVVEGGPNTVRTVHEAVVENNIPAVFFEGTGRCCDLFAKAYRLYNEYCSKSEQNDDNGSFDGDSQLRRKDELKDKLRQELKQELQGISGTGDAGTGGGKGAHKADKKPRKTDETDYFELVYECIDKRINFLNVVSLNSRILVEPDIDLAILQALLKATASDDPDKASRRRKREQLRLALDWNRVDIVRNYIMTDLRDWEKIDINDMFELALTRVQTDFVKLFLEHDFPLTGIFRNRQLLPSLYMRSIKELPQMAQFPENSLKLIYEEIIQPLIGDFFDVDAALCLKGNPAQPQFDTDEENSGCSCCASLKRKARNSFASVDLERVEGTHAEDPNNSRLDADKELFIWSVITGRRDFNLLFWARGKNKISAALFAALIYRIRARKDNDNSYCKSADEFEKLAVQILDRFHQVNAHACTKAIIRQIPAYGNATWLELAIKAEAKEFISQRAVQDVLNNIWYGYIDHRQTHKTIVFSTLMPWYSGFLHFHDQLVKSSEQTTFLDDLFSKSKLMQKYQTNRLQHRAGGPSNDVQAKLIQSYSITDSSPVRFVPVGCWEKTVAGVKNYFHNISKFIRAPYVKFLYSLYFHLAFLTLFSYLLLSDFYPLYDHQLETCPPRPTPSVGGDEKDSKTESISSTNQGISQGFQIRDRPAIKEFILAIWVFTLFCEEIRQFVIGEANTFRKKAIEYLSVFWNILDIVAIIFFCIGFALRFLPARDTFCMARIVLSIDLALWYLRLLDIFAAMKQLGPKLVMIGEMARDLKMYMLMLFIFVVGYGVAAHSLIYGSQEFSWHMLREAFNLAYWQVFGDLNTSEAFENNFRPNAYAVFLLLIIYMAIVSILLVNLLIAMFSNTFDRLENDTDRIWKFQRYSLICEYLSRPSLPPPFILFSHLWRFILYALAQCTTCTRMREKYNRHADRTQYKISVDERYASNIEIVEDAFGDEVYYNYVKFNRDLITTNISDEERIQTPHEIVLSRMRALEDRMQMMNTQQAQVFDYLDSIVNSLQSNDQVQISVPERRRFDSDESLNTIGNAGNRGGRYNQRDSPLQSVPRQSSAQSDDSQSAKINLFAPRRT